MSGALVPMAALGEGEMAACEVDGQSILVCHVEGQYYAVRNRCSHAGQKLSSGKLGGFYVTCPLHGARFDIRDGGCKGGPAPQPIQAFQVMLEAGRVRILTET